jgi:hypothetical protein
MKAPKALQREVDAYVTAKSRAQAIISETLAATSALIKKTSAENKELVNRLAQRLEAWTRVNDYLIASNNLIGQLSEMHRDYCDAWNNRESIEQLKEDLRRAELRNKELYQQLKGRL